MPSRTSSAVIVHGGTTCVRLKWTNGHRPRCLQAVTNSFIGAACEPEPRDGARSRALGVLHAIDARDELQILADRKVGIEAEALRHVADIALYGILLGADVVAEAAAFA